MRARAHTHTHTHTHTHIFLKNLHLLWWRYDFLIANCWNARCKILSMIAPDFKICYL